jgi:hypothetical protein
MTAYEPGSGITPGSQVTVIRVAQVERAYEPWEGDENRSVLLRFPGEHRPVLLSLGLPGILVIPGDILPLLVSGLKRAVVMVEPEPGECGECQNCAEDARLRRAYGELLAAIQETSGTEGETAQ